MRMVSWSVISGSGSGVMYVVRYHRPISGLKRSSEFGIDYLEYLVLF